MKNMDVANQVFTKAKNVRVLVVGDLMLDEYLWGKVERISPEAPVQVVNVDKEDLRLGGAGNVARNLAAFGCLVAVCGVVGKDEAGKRLRRACAAQGVVVTGLFYDADRITSIKTRVLASNQQIVRIDRETRKDIAPEYEENLLKFVCDAGAHWDIIVVSDYQKGVVTPRLLAGIIAEARERGICVVVDPKGRDYTKYSGATIITPNLREAEEATGVAIVDDTSLAAAAEILLQTCDCQAVLITRGSEGMSLFSRTGEVTHIPAVARDVYDVTGAGDTVVVMLAAGIACGLNVAESARLANVAAGIAVGKVGASAIWPDEIIDALRRDGSNKITYLDSLAAIVEGERRRGRRVVFTNGCFDLLHVGHVRLLQKARECGDLLVLGLNSDSSVRRLKGEKRPLIGQNERAHILSALDCVDHIVIYDEDTPLNLLKSLRPDVLVKGGDYLPSQVVGKDFVESYGGKLELVNFVDGTSTTRVIEGILESYR